MVTYIYIRLRSYLPLGGVVARAARAGFTLRVVNGPLAAPPLDLTVVLFGLAPVCLTLGLDALLLALLPALPPALPAPLLAPLLALPPSATTSGISVRNRALSRDG